MKKLFVLGSAALVVISSVPDVARGAPAGLTRPSMESVFVVAQLVPAVVQQDLIASMADEIIVACNPYNEKVPMEIIGIARCDDVQEVVVAGIEKVDAFGRPSYGFAKKEAMTTTYVEMLGAVETANRSPLVQRI